MANFKIAYKRTSVFEGGYVNDPDDNGGETYCGIARKFHSTWKGWIIIDFQKKKDDFPKNLSNREIELKKLEGDFYKENFWDKIWGDKINNQKVANDMYDTAVNMGIASAIRIAQQVIGMTITGKWSDELKYNLMQYGKEE